MKSANTNCPNCGRSLTINEHGFLDCRSCRHPGMSTISTAGKAPSGGHLRGAVVGPSRNVRGAVRLFWPDFIALAAIAACMFLLGQMLFDMLRRHL